MSRASEREAAEKAAAILRRASGRGEETGDYGAGKLTKAQKKSQEKHIPMKEVPQGRLAKFKRDAWG
jgi:hypothetical protein